MRQSGPSIKIDPQTALTNLPAENPAQFFRAVGACVWGHRPNRVKTFTCAIIALRIFRPGLRAGNAGGSLQIFWQRIVPCMLQTQNCAAAKILRGVKFCITRTAQMHVSKKIDGCLHGEMNRRRHVA
jgi:hypothetical protein